MNFYTPVARGTITFNLLRCWLVCFSKNEIYLAINMQCLNAMRTLTKSSLSAVRMGTICTNLLKLDLISVF